MTENGIYRGNGWFWKPSALFMAGVIVSMIGFVTKDIIHQRDFVTKVEAKEMINNAPYPYIPDRKAIYDRFDILDKRLDKIEASLEIIKQTFWKYQYNGATSNKGVINGKRSL